MPDTPNGRAYIRDVSKRLGDSDDTAAEIPAKPPQFTDLGNAQRFALQHGANVRYCYDTHKDGRWIVWDNTRWVTDMSGAHKRMAVQTVESIQDELGVNGAEQAKHYLYSQSSAAITNMVSLAKSQPSIPCVPTDFDQNPWLLGVKNGVIDLLTGEFRPARREDLMMCQCPVEYDPEAKAPKWEQDAISRSMGGDPTLIAFLQRACGLWLTGDVSDRAFFVFLGVARGGKGTILSTFMKMMGHDYAAILPVQALLKSKFINPDGPTPSVVVTRGKRLVVASEPDERSEFDENKIKDWTSGDGEISGRGMRDEFRTTPAQFKLVVQANTLPRVRDTSDAMRDRMKIVPFNQRIAEADINKELKAELATYELPGVLNWALAGLKQWREMGLAAPEAVRKATTATLAAQSLVNLFVEESCSVGGLARAERKELFAAYRRWAEETGNYSKMRQQDFYRELLARGDSVLKKSHGVWYCEGIEPLTGLNSPRAPSEETARAQSDAAADSDLFRK